MEPSLAGRNRSPANLGVGIHWQAAGVNCHLDTLSVTWIVIGALSLLIRYRPAEGVVRYLAELTESQSLVEGWLPLVGTIFLFILGSNWMGALVPWSLLELPPSSGELSAPTNDINLTACLALITSHATFYTGFSEFGWLYPMKYFRPVAYLVPLNLLEEFSKPLSLSFRLLGNILADELTLGVLYGLVPIAIPIPVFLLGLFTSGIQALVFATLTGAYLGESIE